MTADRDKLTDELDIEYADYAMVLDRGGHRFSLTTAELDAVRKWIQEHVSIEMVPVVKISKQPKSDTIDEIMRSGRTMMPLIDPGLKVTNLDHPAQKETEIIVKANRGGPTIDLRDNVSNIFQGR